MQTTQSSSRGEYDAIVVGLGGQGSAILYHLAKRGAKVLGLEQYSLGHDRGSSHGESRIIRLAYHEHSDYVPLLKRAWELWRQLESESGEELLFETGCIEAADPGSRGGHNCFRHSLAAAQQHGLRHEVLGGDDVNRRFPGFGLPQHFKAVLAQGGILASERCILAHVDGARKHGACVLEEEPILDWRSYDSADGCASVRTHRGTYKARRLVFAAGSWMPQLLPELQGCLRVERQVLGWFEISDSTCFRKESCPVSVVEGEAGDFYAFPEFERPGMKIGKFNHLREPVDPPQSLDRAVTALDEKVLREGVSAFFPVADGRMLAAAACMFTNSPDHHFILDRHPAHEQVLICSACSGHGFKFCSVVGEIMADLALAGATRHAIGLHRLAGPAAWRAELRDRLLAGQGQGRSKL